MEDSGRRTDSKTGKNSAPNSYRPISLLPVLSKLAEKVILARLNDHLDRKISDSDSTGSVLVPTSPILRVVEFFKGEITKDECSAWSSSLDIQKPSIEYGTRAYSFKLITITFPPLFFFLINFYISDRSFTVKINRTYSKIKKLVREWPRVILAPTYLIYEK
ncbi:hypothetical protein TNIN_136461 [Trichonephila inaurata madagascariensis]|uniref:Uncharacterized protein n=1 Tax=Trichonephila inaurata madagascariensis TaxID=2747483 RepID=A0A8X7C9N8_9ARAC|nr:hypothetical protein TNIN_136461 [Trichonephila inaurata madagascariensis]